MRVTVRVGSMLWGSCACEKMKSMYSVFTMSFSPPRARHFFHRVLHPTAVVPLPPACQTVRPPPPAQKNIRTCMHTQRQNSTPASTFACPPGRTPNQPERHRDAHTDHPPARPPARVTSGSFQVRFAVNLRSRQGSLRYAYRHFGVTSVSL